MMMVIGSRHAAAISSPSRQCPKVFRGKLLEGLARLHHRRALELAGSCVSLADAENFRDLKDRLCRKEWVVYAKRPFGGPEQVFQYLGRYTHRVGLSNQRLVSFDGRDVRFRTKHGNTTTINAVEFVRRFLLHVLPIGFVKIRHYGSRRCRQRDHQKLGVARRCLLDASATPPPSLVEPPPTWGELLLVLTGIDVLVCPACRSRSMERHPLPPRPSDTS